MSGATLDSDPAHARTAAASADATAVALQVGERIGDRYVIRAFLGEGGMGAVYRALDDKLGVEVALKVVRGAAAISDMLRDEVRLAQQVTHANVCRTFDLEEIGGRYFVKMEHVAGETLAARLSRDKQLAIDEAVRIARDIAGGLAAAHVKHIVHRDLKPGNVMLAADRVVLMDFGLAQHVADGGDVVAGTPGYMSPEQLDGRALDHRSDYYALGCVVYEMITGERVFPGVRGTELADRHRNAAPPDVRDRRPEAPRWLARAIDGLLAKDPSARDAGLRALAGSRRGTPAVIVALAVAAAALAIAVVTRSTSAWQPQIQEIKWPYVEDGVNSSAAVPSPDGKMVAFVTSRDPDGQLVVMPTSGGDARIIAPRDANLPSWTADGAALLFAESDGHVHRYDFATSTLVDLGGDAISDVVSCGADQIRARFSLAGLTFTSEAAEVRYRSPSPLEGLAGSLHCDPKSKRLSFSIGPSFPIACVGDVYVIDGAAPPRQVTTGRDVCGGTIVPGGRSVVYAAKRNGSINLYERSVDRDDEHQLTTGPGPDVEPEVSADGRVLAFAHRTYTSEVTVFDGARERQIRVKTGVVDTIVPTRDFKYLIAQRNDPFENGELIETIEVAAGTEHVIAHGTNMFPSFDGKRVYFRPQDHEDELHVVATEGGPEKLVAKLPGVLLLGADAIDGVHVMTEHEHEFAGWKIDERGTVTHEAAGLVIPAPQGGWRVVQIPALRFRLLVVPPGASVSEPSREVEASSIYVSWIDDHHVGAMIGGRLSAIDVTTGVAEPIATASRIQAFAPLAVLSADGASWAKLAFPSPNLSRAVITNFGDRPWR